jgi:hypothetical protein
MKQFHKHAFSPEELAAIDDAFNGTWTVLYKTDPYSRWQEEETLKRALRKKLFAFARHGVNDRERLMTLTLRNFGL